MIRRGRLTPKPYVSGTRHGLCVAGFEKMRLPGKPA
jgi:hypothetical protein